MARPKVLQHLQKEPTIPTGVPEDWETMAKKMMEKKMGFPDYTPPGEKNKPRKRGR